MTRVLLSIVVLCIAGCGRSPESLGITGPGAPQPLPTPHEDISPVGVPTPYGGYGPSIGPMPSNGPYFNYN